MNETTNTKQVNPAAAVISLLAIVATIVIGLKLGFGAQMSVFAAAIVSVIAALLMKAKWADIQKAGMENIANYNMAFVILTMVGILISTWLIGGTLPSLIYYGLKLISPTAIVPLTFVLCSVTSVCTGTSFGCVATMGLALYGVGVNLGIPGGVIAGRGGLRSLLRRQDVSHVRHHQPGACHCGDRSLFPHQLHALHHGAPQHWCASFCITLSAPATPRTPLTPLRLC